MFARLTSGLLTDVGLFLMRSVVGAVFVFHGAQKLFGIWGGPGLTGFATLLESLGVPYPAHAAVSAASTEFLGGLALISGFNMRLAIAPLIPTMGVAIYFVHRHNFAAQDGGMEYPLTLGLVVMGLCLTGPGNLAIQRIPGLALLEKILLRAPRRLDIRESLADTITESVRQSPQYASLMRQRSES